AGPPRARGTACTSSETPRDDRADLNLVGVLDNLAVGQEQVAADHHRRPGQDAELDEQLPHPPPPLDLHRAALRAQMDAHGRGAALPRAPDPLKAGRGGASLLDRADTGPYTKSGRLEEHSSRVRHSGADGQNPY